MADRDLTTCPYNPAHSIKKSRLQSHLLKCRKNHEPLHVCNYNHTHRFPAESMIAHLASCPDRSSLACQILRRTQPNQPAGFLGLPDRSEAEAFIASIDSSSSAVDGGCSAIVDAASPVLFSKDEDSVSLPIQQAPSAPAATALLNNRPSRLQQKLQLRRLIESRRQEIPKTNNGFAKLELKTIGDKTAASGDINPGFQTEKSCDADDESEDERGSQRTTASRTVGRFKRFLAAQKAHMM